MIIKFMLNNKKIKKISKSYSITKGDIVKFILFYLVHKYI